VLLGKLESIQGVTTKQQDPEFGPEVNNWTEAHRPCPQYTGTCGCGHKKQW
jgi:hypothetical protein